MSADSNSASSDTKSEDVLPRITTKDDLLHNFQSAVEDAFLAPEEKTWMRIAFNKLAGEPGYWSLHDIIVYLSIQSRDPRTGIPQWSLFQGCHLLLRLLRCLGAYPYHLEAPEKLSYELLQSAIVMLLRRDHETLRRYSKEENEPGCDEHLARRFRRLVFQCLSHRQSGVNAAAKEDDSIAQEEIKIALGICKSQNGATDSVDSVDTKLEENDISISEKLPKPNASLHDRVILRKDLRPFVSLLLSYQLDSDGGGSRSAEMASDEDNFVATSVCATTAFDPDPENPESAMCWEEFDFAIEHYLPNLFSVFGRLFGNLLHPFPITQSESDNLPRMAFVARLTDIVKNRRVEQLRLPPSLHLSRLAQFTTILRVPKISRTSLSYQTFPLQGSLQRYLRRGSLHRDLQKTLSTGSEDTLLIYTGRALDDGTDIASETVIFAAWFVKHRTTPSPDLVFQCSPFHRVFHGFDNSGVPIGLDENLSKPDNAEGLLIAGRNFRNEAIKLDFSNDDARSVNVKEWTSGKKKTWSFELDEVITLMFERDRA